MNVDRLVERIDALSLAEGARHLRNNAISDSHHEAMVEVLTEIVTEMETVSDAEIVLIARAMLVKTRALLDYVSSGGRAADA